MMSYELTRWLAYRRIKHPQMSMYIWGLPALLLLATHLFFFTLPVQPALTGEAGVLRAILSVLALLPGFFIAALAAVATFERESMDMEMPEPVPEVEIRVKGNMISVGLTRRIFLTYLFSYLTITSLIVSALCITAELAAPGLSQIANNLMSFTGGRVFVATTKFGFITGVLYLCFSIFVTMLHGVYFFVERMHQPPE